MRSLDRVARERLLALAVGATVTILALVGLARVRANLGDHGLLSGLALAGAVLACLPLGVRRAVPFLPLGRTAVWLRAHAVSGAVASVLFVAHVGLRVPRGPLEATLALVFVIVAGGGALGLWLDRVLARRLAQRGSEVIYERIPEALELLRERARQIVRRALRETGSRALADFHAARLEGFFDRPAQRLALLLGAPRALRAVTQEADALERYLTEPERKLLAELLEVARAKDTLDFQATLQGALRVWPLIHVPLTYALLLLMAAHAALAGAFAPR